MTDIRLDIANARSAELWILLQAAVNGDPHWRRDAHALLTSIDRLELPDPDRERLRRLDDLKRKAEQMEDIVDG